MLKRSRKLSFFPNAWVFPGGRLDAGDYDFPSEGGVKGLEEKAFAVAAVRECFEESGVWLGNGTPSPGLRRKLNARECDL
jgi:8-oxo-dGTP pyrophosphatase MutT (NUDIX family)